MDPLTQGLVGSVAPQIFASRTHKVIAGCFGFLAGMAPDLDLVIRSSTDPLLHLEYHRQFTHSLIFIPFGALLCAVFFSYLWRRLCATKYLMNNGLQYNLSFSQVYLFCFMGYATHAILDACTTYGTLLFWPFNNTRIAWNIISVIDPLFTIPLAVLVFFAIRKKSTYWTMLSLIYMFSYLGLSVLQNSRAEAVAEQLAASRGHSPTEITTRPSFANIIVWKSVYQYQDRYYVDAIRVLGTTRVIPGVSIDKLNIARHFPWLDEDSQQAEDIQRFSWFSQQYLGVDPHNPLRIIDLRYSLIPNRIDGMWGIVLDRNAQPTDHVLWTVSRPKIYSMGENFNMLWSMIIE